MGVRVVCDQTSVLLLCVLRFVFFYGFETQIERGEVMPRFFGCPPCVRKYNKRTYINMNNKAILKFTDVLVSYQ